MRAQAIVMPLPPRTGGTLFGKTIETVLAERPCRVVMQAEPAAQRRRRRRAPRGPADACERVTCTAIATRVLSVVMVVLGVAILVSTIARGGGPLAVGVLLGVLFVAAGAGRLYVERARGREEP